MTAIRISTSRRSLLVGAAGLAAAAGVAGRAAAGAEPLAMTSAQRLETYMRLRTSTDGRPTFGWLDAVRSTVVDGEVTPFCRMLACSIQSARRLSDELFDLNTLEVCFYVDNASGELLTHFLMPGAASPAEVPIYRAGPTSVRFAPQLDEWEENVPGAPGAASAAIAPKGRVHLVRSIGQLEQRGDQGFLRTDEYGRLYPLPDKPPSVFYREWLIWRAPMAEIRGRAPSIRSQLSYSALSSWRPWMKMGDIKGHTAENGEGGKAASAADLPEPLRRLLRAHHPDVLDRPDDLIRR